MITATVPRPTATGAGENHRYPEIVRQAIAAQISAKAERQKQLSDELEALGRELKELFREYEA